MSKVKTLPSEPIHFRTKDGADFDIPEEGSLSLLALGYVGVMAWRQKRKKNMTEKASVPPTTGKI